VSGIVESGEGEAASGMPGRVGEGLGGHLEPLGDFLAGNAGGGIVNRAVNQGGDGGERPAAFWFSMSHLTTRALVPGLGAWFEGRRGRAVVIMFHLLLALWPCRPSGSPWVMDVILRQNQRPGRHRSGS